MITMESVYKAKEIMKGSVLKTPLIPAALTGDLKNVYLKCENMQVTGSFKIRGAMNRLAHLSDAEKQNGIIAFSAGNHAQGVAYSAKTQNISATICIPKTAPISKIEATRGHDANVVLCDGGFEGAMQVAMDLKEKFNYTVVHPYDHVDIISGQGTIGLEIFEDLEDIDTVVVSIGGGGLISGVAYVLKQLKPSIEVIGVEAENVASMKACIDANEHIEVIGLETIADGIAVKKPGKITLEMVKKYVDHIVTVNEDEIYNAMLSLLEKNHLVVEGAGAAAYAAILSDKINIKNKKVACVLSGGNVDVEMLNRSLNRALINRGRLIELSAEIYDKPGTLAKLINDIANLNGNIIQIDHNRTQLGLSVNRVIANILIETFDEHHAQRIYDTISTQEYVLRWESKNYENIKR